jgi:hypothetical protein
MDGPFIQAWSLLKGLQSQLNTPSLDDANHNALAERLWRKRKNTNEPIRVPAPSGHVQEMVALHNASRGQVYDPIKDDIKAEQRHRKLLNNKDRFKQVLNNYIPRLHHNDQEDSGRKKYTVDVGPRSVGWVDVVNGGSLTTVGEGKVNPNAQRQGLYGRALQGIINDAGNLTSYERNEDSQPFHEQFNPPNATKEIKHGYINYNDVHQYTAKPPQETPREFGDLQYDTGAMPVFNRGTEAPLRTGEQQSIYEALNPFIPGGVNGQN